MKINTISAYVLVCLLTSGHWNLLVPVRAGEGGDGGSKTGEDRTGTGGVDGSTFVININPPKEIKWTKNYILESGNNIKLYRIKSGKKCSKVKLGDKEVWKYGSGEYPEKVRYLQGDNKVFIHFANNVVKTYKQNEDKWEEETEGGQGDGKANDQGSTGTQKASQPAGGTKPANQQSGGTTGKDSSGGGGSTQQSTPATQ